ncbi:hypothetical protein [Sulfurisoma sediminicola]|uniref:Outer membrane protein with beta-barrel domain n=1 Tax=Sulfurisoma sediminicola TaxID=1381557 RepID=A0A497XLI4_9PROT|nr:hypothetical protein [Sulfurisoma sediminicola]RLJ68260.1 hypothetical protein DFR35_0814 [Sulfurisoma sediminicola]
MQSLFSTRRATCAILGVAALAAPLSASAQSGSDEWKFRASIYGWLPAFKVTSNFPPPLGLVGGGNTQVDGGDILDAIESVFMGSFEARKGRWGGFADVVTIDLGKTKTGAKSFTVGGNAVAIPANASLSADYNLSGTVWTLAGEYAAIDEPAHNLNVVAGLRYLALEQKFNWAFSGNIGAIQVPLRSGVLSSDGSVTDAIIGIRGRARLGDGGWFLPYYGDVGAGGSNSTWQAMVGLGYSFGWGDITAAYRGLGYKLPDSKMVTDLRLSGGLVGVSFRF